MPRRHRRRSSFPGATGPVAKPKGRQSSPLDDLPTTLQYPGLSPHAMRPDLFIPYATLPQLRDAAKKDPQLAEALDKRITELLTDYGVTEAPPAQKNPNWTDDERLTKQPSLPAGGLEIAPESYDIWEAGDPDNAFTGLVHLPSSTIHLVPLKPAKRSTPYPIGGITGRRAMPVEHTRVGNSSQGTPAASGAGAQDQERDRRTAERIATGLARPNPGIASHTQLAEIIGLPQKDCVGFSVTQGEGGTVKNFNWTSRSSNTRHFLRLNMFSVEEGTSQMSRTWAQLIMKTMIREFGESQTPKPPGTPPSSTSNPLP
ncbi:hypothetical protein, partial [Streptomyces palmae]